MVAQDDYLLFKIFCIEQIFPEEMRYPKYGTFKIFLKICIKKT